MASLSRADLVLHRETIVLGGVAPYRHPPAAWSKLLTALGRAPSTACEARAALRVAAQLHDEAAKELWQHWVPAVRRLRAAETARVACACRVVLTTRVRAPLAHYLSAYLWATRYKPNIGNQLSRPRTSLDARTNRSHTLLPRPSFFEWSSAARNLQARAFVNGDTAKFVTEEQSGRIGSGLPPEPSERVVRDTLLHALDRDFDVVYPLEDFDDGLALIAALLGLDDTNASVARAMQYERISPRRRFYGGMPEGEAKARAIAEACPNMTACEEHVRRIAPLDALLHAHATTRFREQRTRLHAQKTSTGEPGVLLPRFGQHFRVEAPILSDGHSPRTAPAWLLARHSPSHRAAAVTKPAEKPMMRRAARSGCHGGSEPLAAATADFIGSCHRSVSVDSTLEVTDDEGTRLTGVDEETSPCVLPDELARYRKPQDALCEEVRSVFYFAPPPGPDKPPRTVRLPRLPPSPCNVALVDNTTVFIGASPAELGWQLRRFAAWPFPNDAPRTAHYLKVIAPLIFNAASIVLAADVKCLGGDGGLPCAVMRPQDADDMRVAKNRWYKARSVEGEFVHTWKHMKERRMGASVFREINEQLSTYERASSAYDLHALFRLPDTFCIGTRAQSPTAREFACRLGREVATRSMREQLSFDHARPERMSVSWWPMTTIREHDSTTCVRNTSTMARPVVTTVAAAATALPTPPLKGLASKHVAATAALDACVTTSERCLEAARLEAEILAEEDVVNVRQRVAEPKDGGFQGRALAQGADRPAIEDAAPLPVTGSVAIVPAARPSLLRHAVCVTGLARSFDEIGVSVATRLHAVIRATADNVILRKFAVKPVNDSWTSVESKFGPFATIAPQAPCRSTNATPISFFTCTRGRSTSRTSCTGAFVQMMCDLAACEALIRRYESSHALARDERALTQLKGNTLFRTDAREASPPPRFDYVTWMRLDVVWEMSLGPPLPLRLPHGRTDAVWLPQMNGQQGGLCDKFAFGTRGGMARYLNRYDLIGSNFSSVPRNSHGMASLWACSSDAAAGTRTESSGRQVCVPKPFIDTASLCKKRAGCMISLNSERFLAFALYTTNVTVVRMRPWAFCKFGNSTHAWHTCTSRLRKRTPCRSLNCPSWMAGGCTCGSNACDKKSWYCVNVPNGSGLLEPPVATRNASGAIMEGIASPTPVPLESSAATKLKISIETQDAIGTLPDGPKAEVLNALSKLALQEAERTPSS